MRSRGFAFICATVACLLHPQPAAAQSFFEKLFGLGSPAPQSSAPIVQQIPASSYRSIRALSRPEPDDRWHGADTREKQSKPGNLRAVCVRLCDGYYWPLNDHASDQTLEQDADRCEASCGTEARLFYQSQDERDPAAMVDRAGQSYGALKTAFLYRTKLINGCGCRPAPWSVAEQNRHRSYAIADALAAQARAAHLAEAGAGVPLPGRKPGAAELAIANAEKLEQRGPSEPAEAGARVAIHDGSEAAAAMLAQHIEQAGRPPEEQASDQSSETPIRSGTRTTSTRTQPRNTETGRARSAKTTVTRSRPQKLASNQPASFLGLGKSKYVWPGDR
ncbi:MAG: DUF2865 domain-containing protein [Hyphomicrobiaceae bacterium]|nr:DUF2865 domain-containing protein [Hyphomicrobiaceae bacterium]